MAALAAIMDFQVERFKLILITKSLPINCQVNWPFGSREEAKIKFSKWRTWQQSWISDLNNFG